MAQVPAEPGSRESLEQKILQVLRGADSPVPTAQLVQECQVPKKELNRVLHQMLRKKEVWKAAPAAWHLGAAVPGGQASPELAQPSGSNRPGTSPGQRPPQDTAVTAEHPGPQLSALQERIYRVLEAWGPCRALHIAQALGMQTAGDVNPELYRLKGSGLLSFNETLRVWTLAEGAEGSGRRNQPVPVVHPQNLITMICQGGSNCHITIENSRATQIGHGNVMVGQQTATGEGGYAAPLRVPAEALGGPSTREPLADASGPLDIHLERSMLRHVQLGHSNEMTLLGVPPEGPTFGFSGSPPVSASAATPEGAPGSAHTPKPSPPAQGHAAQRVLIRSCLLEDATIGNSNRMTVALGAAGGAEGRDGQQAPRPGEDAGPGSEAPGSGNHRGRPPATRPDPHCKAVTGGRLPVQRT